MTPQTARRGSIQAAIAATKRMLADLETIADATIPDERGWYLSGDYARIAQEVREVAATVTEVGRIAERTKVRV